MLDQYHLFRRVGFSRGKAIRRAIAALLNRF